MSLHAISARVVGERARHDSPPSGHGSARTLGSGIASPGMQAHTAESLPDRKGSMRSSMRRAIGGVQCEFNNSHSTNCGDHNRLPHKCWCYCCYCTQYLPQSSLPWLCRPLSSSRASNHQGEACTLASLTPHHPQLTRPPLKHLKSQLHRQLHAVHCVIMTTCLSHQHHQIL